jgi:hypothetical protein
MESTPDREEKMLAEALEELEAPPAYRIENTGDEFVVRIPRGIVSEPALRHHLAVMMLDAVRQKSQLTEEDAMELGRVINHGVWESARRRLGLDE